ncbi:hypothetical protein KAOT1_03842 [Kordia algicida OT-1]|uniref:Uncharacterized protein n=2 Tax=Kordia TaxID=221065 RepID=A9DW52_9FLAO|nr:hypothetical protein KAOT1_03842 [Kordia algicida OT-1]
MIYYNIELMPDSHSAILFMTTNATPFRCFEDHQAGIYIQLHTLVELSLASGEDPIGLIEDYLGITYTEGRSTEEIAYFLCYTDRVQNALWSLEIRWHKKTDIESEASYMEGGLSKEKALELFTQITLRRYLEALSNFTDEK